MCNQHSPETLIYKLQLENEYANTENIPEITSHQNILYYKDSNIINTSSTDEIVEDTSNPFITLRNLRFKNLEKNIIGYLNVNSVRNKINMLKSMMNENIDILFISKTKIDNSFSENQFTRGI